MSPTARLRRLVQWPWHPLLIGTLPVLHFWRNNFRLVPLADGARLMLLAAFAALVLTALLRLVLRDWGRAALVAAPLMAVLAEGHAMGGAVSAGMLAAALVLLVVLRLKPFDAAPLNAGLNAALLVLVAFPVAAKLQAEETIHPPTTTPLFRQPLAERAGPPAGLPDVYFLLVDGLGQPATVRPLFDIPPGTLTEGLRSRGARVLRFCHSNYPQTALSVAATFNVAPLSALLDIPEVRSRDRRPLAELVGDSRVVRAFREAGYRIVTFPSGYPLTRFANPDARRRPRLDPNFLEFYVLNDGALPLVLPLLGRGPADLQYALHRHRLDYIFDHLQDARDGARPDQPVFVFAHLLTPHPPFVWGPGGADLRSKNLFSFGDGNDWTNANRGETVPYGVFWKHQAAWVMQRLATTVDAIRAASPRPPVIIIEGDHGPGSQTNWDYPRLTNLTERFGIFSAWFLPPGLDVPLRDDMTAMATFPALFNGLFGTPQPELEEGLWFARMKYPYEYFPASTGP